MTFWQYVSLELGYEDVKIRQKEAKTRMCNRQDFNQDIYITNMHMLQQVFESLTRYSDASVASELHGIAHILEDSGCIADLFRTARVFKKCTRI